MAPAEYPPDLAPLREQLDVPDWYPFEHEVWGIGESVRRAFVQNPRLKRKDNVLSKVAKVATWQNLRRGRQSFITALGFVAARTYADAIVPFLSDPDVHGQVVYTLIKMKAPGFGREVAPLTHSERTLVRNLAKKYVDRYPPNG